MSTDTRLSWSDARELVDAWIVDLIGDLRTQIDQRCPHPSGRATCNDWMAELMTVAAQGRVDAVRCLADMIRRKVAWEREWHAEKLRRMRQRRREYRSMR